ncbi:hypothetical protein [Cellulomonas carbonis]|uniref:Uncharacterized protein n=1 Tax=Cellulomonas carbonis T26 TaxID=947969 RepID=A0A0A0BQT5_9CELL|nr:hypothetical protein [Cellulomonas carbonis]KGM10326.1 hypothetical protein N868_09345 [Cellulomonas carbonis T26]MDT0164639.1 hypothetical protein [Actinotalea sp. AC32]GGC00133.1 hypothetical protein GCM10010972_11100 [Cellulomonas carbonis]
MADLEQARAVKSRLRADLRYHHGVRGIGVTRLRQGYAVCVNLDSPADDDLPRTIDGVPVEVRVVGRITAQG